MAAHELVDAHLLSDSNIDTINKFLKSSKNSLTARGIDLKDKLICQKKSTLMRESQA